MSTRHVLQVESPFLPNAQSNDHANLKLSQVLLGLQIYQLVVILSSEDEEDQQDLIPILSLDSDKFLFTSTSTSIKVVDSGWDR